jgi:hypothetical protein
MTNRSDGHHSHDHSRHWNTVTRQYASHPSPRSICHMISSIDRYYFLPSSDSFSDAARPPRVLITFLFMGATSQSVLHGLDTCAWAGQCERVCHPHNYLRLTRRPAFATQVNSRWLILQGDWPRMLRDWTRVQPGIYGIGGMDESSLLD